MKKFSQHCNKRFEDVLSLCVFSPNSFGYRGSYFKSGGWVIAIFVGLLRGSGVIEGVAEGAVWVVGT